MRILKLITIRICLFALLPTLTAKSMSFNILISSIESTSINNFFLPDKESKYGKDSILCVRNLSVYREFFRQKNYADALESWRWVFNNCPLSSQNMYLDGIVLYKDLFNTEKNTENKVKLVDTLMQVYDQRIKFFGREGFVLGRKGVDLYYMNPSSFETSYNILKKSVELEKNTSKADVLTAYFQSSIKLSSNEKYSKSIVFETYHIISDIVDWNIKNNPKDSSFFKPTKTNIELLLAPIATCTDLISIYATKLEKSPNDKELLTQITTMLSKSNCVEEELFYKATQTLHSIEPTANSAYLMGKMLVSKNKYTKAKDYLQESINMFKEEESDKKADALLLLAEIYYRNMNQLAKARNYALQSLETKPTDGRPLILIGDMYASSARSCGENEFDMKVAYWTAVDKFIKAKNIDPTLESIANQRISTWSPYFPNTELIFFYNLKPGQAYTVGCWINETTTVR